MAKRKEKTKRVSQCRPTEGVQCKKCVFWPAWSHSNITYYSEVVCASLVPYLAVDTVIPKENLKGCTHEKLLRQENLVLQPNRRQGELKSVFLCLFRL